MFIPRIPHKEPTEKKRKRNKNQRSEKKWHPKKKPRVQKKSDEQIVLDEDNTAETERVRRLTSKYQLQELRDMCAKYNMKTSGTKAQVARRIYDHERITGEALDAEITDFTEFKHDWSKYRKLIPYFEGSYEYYSYGEDGGYVAYSLKLYQKTIESEDDSSDYSVLRFDVLKEDRMSDNAFDESLSGSWKVMTDTKKLTSEKKKKEPKDPNIFDYSRFVVRLVFDHRYSGPSEVNIQLRRSSTYYLVTELKVSEFTADPIILQGKPPVQANQELKSLCESKPDYDTIYGNLYTTLCEFEHTSDARDLTIGVDSLYDHGRVVQAENAVYAAIFYAAAASAWLDAAIYMSDENGDFSFTIETIFAALEETIELINSENASDIEWTNIKYTIEIWQRIANERLQEHPAKNLVESKCQQIDDQLKNKLASHL